MRQFNIDDNKEKTEGNKKVITITINNQCKPIKKEKIKLVKKLFVINYNKNKVNDEKEEIKKYFFNKCLLILKQ